LNLICIALFDRLMTQGNSLLKCHLVQREQPTFALQRPQARVQWSEDSLNDNPVSKRALEVFNA